ncbi:MAG: hypothetical protein LBT80_00995 [Lactobacillaceae bacterium]|nr:hypothetical protein [Lactobacillaceae bacterium]
MNLQRLMKSITIATIAVSLSPLVTGATTLTHVAHAATVTTATTTTPIQNFLIGGGVVLDAKDGVVTDVNNDTKTISVKGNKIDSIQLVVRHKEGERDIFAGLNTNYTDAKALGKTVASKAITNVSGAYVDAATHLDLDDSQGINRWEFNLKNVDVTGNKDVVVTFLAKDTGLAHDTTLTLHIAHK